MPSMRHVAVIALLSGLAGCSVFSPPKAKPVIEDRITDWGMSKIGILATTPERRVVLVRMPDKKLCSEAPADIGESVAAAISATAEASATGRISELQAGMSQRLATSVLQLTHRSQGVQFYRDVSYHLCVMYLNGVMNEEQVREAHARLLDKSDALIQQEIPLIDKIKRAAFPSVAAPELPEEAKLPEDKDGSLN